MISIVKNAITPIEVLIHENKTQYAIFFEADHVQLTNENPMGDLLIRLLGKFPLLITEKKANFATTSS